MRCVAKMGRKVFLKLGSDKIEMPDEKAAALMKGGYDGKNSDYRNSA